MLGQLDEYVALQRVFMPAASFDVQEDTDRVKLVVTSLPPAMQQVISQSYGDLLNK